MIVSRQGYAPSLTTTIPPAQLDLYGLAASVVHVLTRREVADLPQKEEGTPDFRSAMVVSFS
ncbi:MAG: hypothetical protein GY822_15250 [Deltaproteobacteria bacterium]|nr:hypothetical protein [Deltaproteobacteria bacterium]